MVWDRNYYVLEVEKQFSDCRIYQDVSNSENILAKLSQAVSKMVSALKRKVLITEDTETFNIVVLLQGNGLSFWIVI